MLPTTSVPIASTLLLVVDSIGALIGLMSLFVLYRTSRKLGGRVRSGLAYVNGGIFFMTASFLLTIYFTLHNEMNMQDMAYHHLFMLVGMCLFIIAALRFSVMARNI